MKCPKCQKNISDKETVCPFCQTPVAENLGGGEGNKAEKQDFTNQDTRRFSAIDPDKDSYDFDLQYTLTFKDAGEIRQAIADMDLGIGKELPSDILAAEKEENPEERHPEHHQRTIEEMEEAAQRAALRRERRNQGKHHGRSSGHRTHVERMSRSSREKAAALRAAKPRRTRSEQDAQKNRRFIIGAAVAAVVIAVIIGTINLFAGMMDGDVRYPTIYTKENQLYMFYEKKPQQLSEKLIATQAAPAPTATATSASSKNKNQEKKVEDPKAYKKETPVEKQLIHVSEDGMYTFFMENMDMNTGRGDLIYCQNDSRKSRTLVSISVYYKLVIAKDGKSVLYLRNTDDNGYHGELCYWNPDLKEPISVSQDICSDNFVFSQNGQRALYIKNFNPIVNTGDLCLRDFGKDASQESRMLDEKAAFVFGSTPKSDIYLYAKDYDTKTGTYNLYSLKEGDAPALRAEKAFLPPVLLSRNEAVYAYSNYHDNFQTISYLDLAVGTVNTMADEVTKIVRVRKDEGAVIYTKTYAETEKSDYYMVASGENSSQKVANAVTTVKESAQNRIQFDVSEDFSRVAYISGYNEDEGKGALITMSIINGYVGTEKRISDDAYGCDVSADGAVVRFASNYNKDLGTVSLAAYTNSNTVTLTEEVCAGAYTYDGAGEIMVYARDVQSAPINSGTIECVSTKGRIREIDTAVTSYGLKKDGRILLLKKSGEENAGGQLYYSNEKGSRMKLMDEGVTGALFY